MLQRKGQRTLDPGLEPGQELVDKVPLPADAREDCQISVAREPRFRR